VRIGQIMVGRARVGVGCVPSHTDEGLHGRCVVSGIPQC